MTYCNLERISRLHYFLEIVALQRHNDLELLFNITINLEKLSYLAQL